MKKLAIVLALGIARLSYADPLPGMPLDEAPSGILKSARIETGKSWDFSFNGAFIEYYVAEEGLGLAFSSPSTTLQPRGPIVTFDFGYHPGFQAGFTLNTPYDGWTLAGEYLWLRGHHHTSAVAPKHGVLFSNLTFSYSELNNYLGSLKADWKFGIDLGDLYFTHSYYLGTAWTIDPLFGLRGGRIRQYLHGTGFVFGFTDVTHIVQASYKSNSWMIGPRVGFQSNWLLGKGFGAFGNLSASLLYTRYTTLSDKNKQDAAFLIGTNNNSSSLTPNMDAGLGLKWGSYFNKQNYHFDLSAAYNFSVYYSQNQLMGLSEVLSSYAPETSPGRLYLHGVSVDLALLF